jgi:hypothetical protein
MTNVVYICHACGAVATERYELATACRPFARKVDRDSITHDAATRTLEAQNVELPASAWERR